METKEIYAISILTSGIIGAGFFALPYVTLKTGTVPMLVFLVVFGLLSYFLHHLFVRVTVKTPDFVRFPGFVKMHLGKGAGNISYVLSFIGTFGALLAYIIVGGKFLNAILTPYIGGSEALWTLVYLAVGALLILTGGKFISKISLWALIGFFVVAFWIYYSAQPIFNPANFWVPIQEGVDYFLPYGIIFFCFWGIDLVPELEELIFCEGEACLPTKKKKSLTRVVAISSIICFVFFLFFTYLILGISGDKTSQAALEGIQIFLHPVVGKMALLLGILTTITSFVPFGMTLKKVMWYDLRINKYIAWGIVCLTPLFVYLAGANDFIRVIALLGGTSLGVSGVMVILMHKKIYPKKHYLGLPYALIFMFICGIIYEILRSLNFK